MPRRLIQLLAGLVLYGVSDSMLLLAGPGRAGRGSVGRPPSGPGPADRHSHRHLGDHRGGGGAAAVGAAAAAAGPRHAGQRRADRNGHRRDPGPRTAAAPAGPHPRPPLQPASPCRTRSQSAAATATSVPARPTEQKIVISSGLVRAVAAPASTAPRSVSG